eukprot:Skav211662  [mRNA]  locus=scaffold216:6096:11991:+ [translate_table: standard]
MGLTSENVAAAYGIPRDRQDQMAADSHRKAGTSSSDVGVLFGVSEMLFTHRWTWQRLSEAKGGTLSRAQRSQQALEAQKNGWFKEEIVPVTVEDGSIKKTVADKDEGPRPGTTPESLSKMKPAFKAGGSTTAGNSSQLTDGASMVLMARHGVVGQAGAAAFRGQEVGFAHHGALPQLRLRRLDLVVTLVTVLCEVGVDPKLMGIGPAFAIPPALEQAGLKVEDIDIYEINEAFASQATMSVDHLKIPMEKVNPKGGAIALGHPLGATGARQIATLLPELKRQGKKLGVTSMCLGSGMGAASVIELE